MGRWVGGRLPGGGGDNLVFAGRSPSRCLPAEQPSRVLLPATLRRALSSRQGNRLGQKQSPAMCLPQRPGSHSPSLLASLKTSSSITLIISGLFPYSGSAIFFFNCYFKKSNFFNMLFLKGSISSFLRSGPTGLPLPPTLLTPGHQPLSSQEAERRGRQLPLTLGKLWCSSQRRFRKEGEEQGSEARKVWGAKLFLGGSEPLRLFPWVPSQSPGRPQAFRASVSVPAAG